MKLSARYEQTSCRLVLEGFPDLSAGHGDQAIGILTGWSLALAGRPELEGRREHLVALLQVVLPYARHLLSSAPRAFGTDETPVVIAPQGSGHELLLRSSQPDTSPLTLQLDDAELADLVRCLDQLRLDARVQVPLELPAPQPLKRFELRHRQPLRRRLAAPATGVAVLALGSVMALLLPTPKPPTAPAAAPAAPARPLAPG